VSRVGADLSYELRDLPWRLEAGTPDIAAVIGLAAAIEYLDELGMAAIERREHELRELLDLHVAALPGVRALVPEAGLQRAPLLSFSAPTMGAEYLARVLSDSYGIMTRAGYHCAHPLHESLGLQATLRASLAFYNTEAELLRLRDALRALLIRAGS
jgi:cysteine desulfurase/selenocysteine lyase